MVLRIKRESFRGHYYVVVRDKGRFKSRRKWNQKFTIRKASHKFRRDNTLTKDLAKRKLKSRPDLTEIVDSSKRPKIKKGIPFRVVATGLLKDGAVIGASSQARVWGNYNQAKDAAITNFWERVAQHFNQEYDADTGFQFENKVKSVKFTTIKVI